MLQLRRKDTLKDIIYVYVYETVIAFFSFIIENQGDKRYHIHLLYFS